MQIWTNEADLKGMNLEYELIDGKLISCGAEWGCRREVGSIYDDGDMYYNITVNDKSIKLDYAEAHYLFLMLLKENETKVQFAETKIVKSI